MPFAFGFERERLPAASAIAATPTSAGASAISGFTAIAKPLPSTTSAPAASITCARPAGSSPPVGSAPVPRSEETVESARSAASRTSGGGFASPSRLAARISAASFGAFRSSRR